MSQTCLPTSGGLYTEDSRVNPDGRGGYNVACGDGRRVRVSYSSVTGWSAFDTRSGTVVEAAGRLVQHHVTAAAAIRATIGDPR